MNKKLKGLAAVLMLLTSIAAVWGLAPGEDLTMGVSLWCTDVANTTGGYDKGYEDGHVRYYFVKSEIQAPDLTIVESTPWEDVDLHWNTNFLGRIDRSMTTTPTQLGTYELKGAIAWVDAIYNTTTLSWEVTQSEFCDLQSSSFDVGFPEPNIGTLFSTALGGLSLW